MNHLGTLAKKEFPRPHFQRFGISTAGQGASSDEGLMSQTSVLPLRNVGVLVKMRKVRQRQKEVDEFGS